MEHAHYFAFAFESENGRKRSTFSATAHGDLDGDGLESTFRLQGEWDGWKAGVAAFALLGRIAEPGTFLEKRESADRLELDVVTGVVSDEGRFATHGHTLLLRVTP